MPTIKVVELVGTSKEGWEDAARDAIKDASRTIRGIRGIDVVSQTARVDNGAIDEYRTTVKVSFVHENS